MVCFENIQFLEQLAELPDCNVIVLLGDGALVFGRFGYMGGGSIHIFSPKHIPDTASGLFRSSRLAPPCRDVLADEIILDSEAIVQVIQGSFTEMPVTVDTKPLYRNVFIQPEFRVHKPKSRYVNKLVEELKRLEGRNVAVRTVGGWQTAGRLLELSCGTAWLRQGTEPSPPIINEGALSIFGPEVPAIGVFFEGNYGAMVNLRALTGVRIFRI